MSENKSKNIHVRRFVSDLLTITIGMFAAGTISGLWLLATWKYSPYIVLVLITIYGIGWLANLVFEEEKQNDPPDTIQEL